MSNWRYTIIQHAPRAILNITVLEYCVLDMVYQSQTHPSHSKNGWTDIGCHSIASFLGLSTGTVKGIFDRMEYMGYMERIGNFSKRTTPLFYDIAYLKTDAEIETVQKLNVQKLNGKRLKTERSSVQKMNGKRSENEQVIEVKEDLKEIKERLPETEVSAPFLDESEIEAIEKEIFLSKATQKKERKSSAKKKENPDAAPVADMWELYVPIFKELSGQAPSQQAKHFTSLSKICKELRKRALEKNKLAPDLELWKKFLDEAKKVAMRPNESWLHDNFTPSVMWSQFDSILIKMKTQPRGVVPLYREKTPDQQVVKTYLF